ncbi:MAG: YdhR family protein [Actinomycetota bacterium]
MHVQVVTFGLNGITEEQYHQTCDGATATFAALPGLLSKTWLRNADANTYGGVYLWRDRESYEDYVKGEVFKSIQNDPSLVNVASNDFDVFEDLTKATQPVLSIV